MKSCSIIIPVYNNWKYTKQCLDSIILFSKGKDVPGEIIVIDDDSEDGTEDKIKTYISANSFIRYYKNQANVGFAASCNFGAGRAEGDFLVFLNNDTKITEGWLDQLLTTIGKDRDTWMVGAKCLYPDLTVQHAGVAFPDSYKNYLPHIYKDVPRFFPLINYEKEYQCVTGACCIIRKEDFKSLNGFDESYRNGFEDVDLCIRIVEKGKKIIYQPGCEIIHYESKSEGRFDNSKLNKDILIGRWESKIRPDEVDHFRNDLAHCLKEGGLKLKEDLLDHSAGNLRFEGNISVITTGFIELQSLKNLHKIFIPEQVAGSGEYLLIAGEFNANSTGTVKLKYLTSGETKFTEQQCFLKKAHSGRNIFYFTLNPAFLHGELLLEFVNFKEPLEINKFSIYTFRHPSEPENIPVALIFNTEPDQEQLQQMVGSLNSDKNAGIKVEAFIKPGVSDYNPARLPADLNDFLAGRPFKYAILLNEFREISIDEIKHITGLMETDPGIGVVYGGQAGFLPIHSNFISGNTKKYQLSLRGASDIPLAFRIASWEDAGRFDQRFGYYFNLDLCFSVLETGNWKGFAMDGNSLLTYQPESGYPTGLKAGLDHFRSLFFEKHGLYLANLLIPLISSEKVNKQGQGLADGATGQIFSTDKKPNPHDTLFGSVKVHLKHYLNKKLKRF